MEENPYRPPTAPLAEVPPRSTSNDVRPTFAYAIIGFLAGTGIAGLFVMTKDPLVRIQGGAMFGGTIGCLVGYLLGLRKVRS